MPERIQMSRQRPWRAEHPDAVIVARPTKWGNPFKVGWNDAASVGVVGMVNIHFTPVQAVALFRALVTVDRPEMAISARAELAGKNLACWCPLDQLCHADVLLELANRPLCPECAQGKTGNCIGWTLDADDNEVACATAQPNRGE